MPAGTVQAVKICSFESCDKTMRAKDLCQGHYAQQRKGKPMQEVGSERPNRSRRQTARVSPSRR